MALIQINRRLFTNSLLASVLLLSVGSFVTFTFFTSNKTSVPNSLSKKLQIPENTDSESARHIAQKIKSVQEKIKINDHNRSTAVSLTDRAQLSKQITEIDSVHLGRSKDRHNVILSQPNYNVHIFYYPWYKNVNTDGKYAHWNHRLLPHWSDKHFMNSGQHVPPEDIGANYYPKLGAYSSADPAVIDAHMQQIRAAGPGVLSVSWYPPHFVGSSETPVDDIMMKLFDAAAKYQLKIAFHFEPFKNRSGQTLREVVKYVIETYGNHTAFYRLQSSSRQLPVFYVYDSYQIQPQLWAEALYKDGQFSIRNTKYDAIFLGLLVEFEHFNHLTDSGFDGFYTYFASNGFVYGSTWHNWPSIASEAKKRNLIFVPSIGPGYLDTRVRQWNGKNTKLRLNGKYYENAFKSALAVKPKLLSITSFNEWHEGTQVEAAVPKTVSSFKYEDYQPNGPEFYLNLTRMFVEEFRKNMVSLSESYYH
ncbi:unnamed protein product [Candidula unifasciata]|uniref:Glycoprotein endo-alpha-1,2-mannosidase n=1 Tax=Candidula unifasciata TaxID=100452 RepID=A0A8S3ZQK9_9EUPU|nr:unnamed protein product [Candidula unifasciata]